MCRWVLYKGKEKIPLTDLLIKSKHSLIKQSYCSQERREPLNGDGFGVGWYDFSFAEEPCLFTSIRPAWADRNLRRLSPFVKSSCLFAHVRAATPGLPVTELNCHPFKYKTLMWMHNGQIGEFCKVKRPLREKLSNQSYAMIQGNTDSEHTFALFVDQLPPNQENFSSEELRDAMHATIAELEKLTKAAGVKEDCIYNFAVTDGQTVVATHHSTGPKPHYETLYYAQFQHYECPEGNDKLVHTKGGEKSYLVASEPITDDKWEWIEVPKSHSLTITPDFQLSFAPI